MDSFDLFIFWKDHWIMIASTVLLTVLGLVLFVEPSRAAFLRTVFFAASKEQPQINNWLNDPQFVKSFGELHKDLQSEDSQHLLQEYNDKEPHVTHFLFLVHGFHGFTQDLAYLETVLRLMVDREKYRFAMNSSSNISASNSQRRRHDMVVHCPTCNEHRTKDGVIVGGERLWQEMLETIQREMENRYDLTTDEKDDLKDITISLLGNSLGGLYSRYALAKLMEHVQVVDDDNKEPTLILDGKYRIHLNIYCSTASPHLGISKHTYIPIPRPAEIGAAYTMGESGKDLFRLNDLLRTMATTPEYLEPLGRFRKRIAYANAYGTDFPVPTATAAFLHTESSYPHHIVETAEATYVNSEDEGTDDDDDDDDGGKDSCVTVVDDSNSLVVAIFHTPSAAELKTQKSSTPADTSEDDENTTTESEEAEHLHADDMAYMSHSLDSLGWKKVFVDLRKEIPIGLNLPYLSGAANSMSPLSFQAPSFFDKTGVDSTPVAAPTCRISVLRRQGVVASRDVASATSVPPDLSRISWPLGHNMIVAFSRSPKAADFNKGGRPVVDALASELVEFIFSWKQQVDEEDDAARLD